MPVSLSTRAADFETRFQALLDQKREAAPDVAGAVRAILEDVRARGAEAVIEATAKFDRLRLTPETLAVSPEEVEAAAASCAPEDLAALELAAARIRAYHERQIPPDARWTDEAGVELGWRWTALDSVGLYVPGGKASYPSSVLMNAVPAQVAGVRRIAICMPAPDGALNPLALAAARLAGVSEIYRIGGAQAVGAFAYGAGPLKPVDKITGPGNAYVAEAKRQVFGRVGIDSIAGPSEVLVIAESDADPDWIAMDLLAQAEHDESAQSILIVLDESYGEAVAQAVGRALKTLPRREIAAASWEKHGAILLVRDLTEAAALSDRLAPEHLQLCVADPEALAAQIRHAGAIFMGLHTPEALGDYVGGPNHVLPTDRTARFASGLSVLDFLKRTSLLKAGPEALAAIGPAAARLASAEGLQAHGASVSLRLGNGGPA
ncbi:histidinol dehydrogenase [Neomegalonema perideroedes]|uniref:histidinol dehydrogenase n=1 Tax=Neomegalonema perideroedes TaxID=217219 RepID=UPI000477A8B5|nr:histidinol dehydrogenase [Neomegalonema perideroedes]